MSAAAAPAAPRTERPGALEVYRDDGPLARLLGTIGRGFPLPPIYLIAAGAGPLLALMIARGESATEAAVAIVVGWYVIAAALSRGRPHTDRLRWAVPGVLRLVEYATIVWIGALAGASSRPAAFALLCVLAFRHYDLVYRLRHQGTTPLQWVGDVALGWDGRLVLAYLLWVAGALPEGYFVAACVLAVVFVAESVASWRRWGRTQQPVLYDDEEDAAE
jgi:Family of unknown function (DUF5941)